MLEAADANRQVKVFHVCKSQEDFALRTRVEAAVNGAANRTLQLHTTENGKWTADQLAALVTPDADYVICGPDGFMKTVIDTLKGHQVDDARIHYERFGVGSI